MSNNESTLGKSAIQPHKILANVFVMPIIDNRNDAELWSTPYFCRKREIYKKKNSKEQKKSILTLNVAASTKYTKGT